MPINAAQQVVEKRGYLFGVYTGMSYYNEHIDRKLVKCNNWWIARYYNSNKRMQIATAPDQEKKPDAANIAWQYTSSGNFDLNVVYKEPTSKKVEETKKTPAKTKTVYYPKYRGKSSSIVDALKSLKINSSKKNREKIATLNGIKNYKGGASQNTKLINLLKRGKLIKSK